MNNRRMVMRYTGRRVCCALLSAVLITGGLPCGAGATGFPGRMTARAAAVSYTHLRNMGPEK